MSLGAYLWKAWTHHRAGHVFRWSIKGLKVTEISHYCRLPENSFFFFLFLKVKGNGSLSHESFKCITFSCHDRTHSLKKLCSLICKRSLPRFFKIHPHRCLGSRSARWLCYSSSLSLGVYLYKLSKALWKRHNLYHKFSYSVAGIRRMSVSREGNNQADQTQSAQIPSSDATQYTNQWIGPQLPGLGNAIWKLAEIGCGSHNPSVTQYSHHRSQVVSFSKIHKAHVCSLWRASVLSESLLKFGSERMPSSQKPQYSRMIPSATGWASFSAKYIIYNLSNCEKVRVEFF